MKRPVVFVVIAAALSAPGYYLQHNAAVIGLSPLLAVLYLMWCPALAAVMTALIFDRSLKGFGWGLRCGRWLALGYAMPIAYSALGYAIIWSCGWAGIKAEFSIDPLKLVLFGTVFNVVYAAGEEIGWRGYLAPQLNRAMGFTRASFATGSIWALWHYPMVIGAAYLNKMPLLPQLALMTVSLVGMTFVFNWLRLRSGSLWPAVVIHASHNLYIQWLFDPASVETSPLSKYMLGESGLVLTAIYTILGAGAWHLNRKDTGAGSRFS